MVDRASAPAQAEIDDVLSRYGISDVVVKPRAEEANDAASILRGYGVVPKPQDHSTAPAARRAAPGTDYLSTGDISKTKPGKIPDAPENPPNPADIAAGEKRGLGAQFVGAMPIIGPALNLATAALKAGPSDPANPAATFTERFNQAEYDQRRADTAFARENPLTSTAANFAGSAGPYMGLGMTGMGRALLGMNSALPWGTRVYQGVAGGAGINAADAALRGENPLTAAEIGAAGGVLAPTTAGIARSATAAAADHLWPRSGMLKGLPVAGVGLLTNALEAETPASLAAAKARIGPAGFFGDLNPALTDIAGAISDTPGAKGPVQEAYRSRAAGQAGRIDAALTQAMGPSTNIVEYKNFLTETRKAAADPLYQQWRDSKVYPTPELKAMIPRLEKAGAFGMAEELSGISGEPINRNFFTPGAQKDYPTAQSWDYVKRGLDRRIDQAYTGGDKTLARELLNLKGEMIGEIEKTSAGKVWKQARGEFADRSALMDQVDRGRDTFLGSRSGNSADEMAEELQHLSGPELMARITGARSAASDAMGDTLRGDSTLRNKLLATNNQKKLRLLLGDAQAEKLITTLQQEGHLAEKTSAILPNMNTGASGETRAQRRKMFDAPELPSWFDKLEVTKPATWIPPSLSPHNVLQSFANDRAARAAPALSPLMTTPSGPRMDHLISALTAERDRVAGVHSTMAPWTNALAATVSGPGQFTYLRGYENRN